MSAVVLPKEQVACLNALAKLGIHGSSADEVARTLLASKIEQLITDGIIPASAASSSLADAIEQASKIN